MVIRSFTWKVPHFHRLVRYISKNRDHPERIEIRHNLRPDQSVSDQFWNNEEYRKRGKVRCFHEVLSFHKRDTPYLSRDVIVDLVTQYLELRAPNALAFGMTHHDTDHVHVHLMISALELRSSRSLWLGKKRFGEIQKELEAYQQARYPKLSSVVHLKARGLDRGVEQGWQGWAVAQFREAARVTGRKEFYAQCEQALVDDVIARCFEKAESREDFFRRVEETGIELYEYRLGPRHSSIGTLMVHEWNVKGGRATRTFIPLKVNVWELPGEEELHRRAQERTYRGGATVGDLAASRIRELEAIYEQQVSEPEMDRGTTKASADAQGRQDALQGRSPQAHQRKQQVHVEGIRQPPSPSVAAEGMRQERERARLAELEQIREEKRRRVAHERDLDITPSH